MEGTLELAGKGLADSRPHRLQLLGARPQRRFFPTREGIVALASGERAGIERLMRLYPVSRQWFRVLAERLDAVAPLYRVASIIAGSDASEAPVVVTHCRTGPYDLLLRLPSGGTLGLVRQGPMLTNASLCYRIRTIERMKPGERPLLTLILTDSEQDMRRVLRAIADPSAHGEMRAYDFAGLWMLSNIVHVHYSIRDGRVNAATSFDLETGWLWRVDSSRQYPGTSGRSVYRSSQWASFSSHAGAVTSNTVLVRVPASGSVTCTFSSTGFQGHNLPNLLHYRKKKCGTS